MATVAVTGLVKEYAETRAVDDVSFSLDEGEFFSVLGPSGSGKTTTLRMVAGFVTPTSGSISVDGVEIIDLPPEKRDVGLVFQNYAIFPHKNVYDNIAFGLRIRKMPKEEIRERVGGALRQVGLSGYENRFQSQLSGGEQQRVALARVLVTEPRILLLDEPLSALDRKLREEMRAWLKELQQRLGITTLYVTHDQGEALNLSDRIAVMHHGKIEQIGTPRDVYDHPRTGFVADFIGDANKFPVHVTGAENGYLSLAAPGFGPLRAPLRDGIAVGDDVTMIVRPEKLLVGDHDGAASFNKLQGRILGRSYEGAYTRYRVELEGCVVAVEVANRSGEELKTDGEMLQASWHPDSSVVVSG